MIITRPLYGRVTLLGVSALSLAAFSSCGKEQPARKPNVVFIMADDLGIGDIGCYGQQIIKTPNIDRLASLGMLFTDHYAGATVSAPSRASLMSGLHTGHSPVRGNKELPIEGQSPLSGEVYTMAEMFRDAGYATGAFGKWGLGYPGSEGDPINQGFDEFLGYNCQREAHRYYPTHLWHNDQKMTLSGNSDGAMGEFAPDIIHRRSLEFIRENADRPFFAYVPIVQPHAELISPDDELMAEYRALITEDKSYSNPRADYGSETFTASGYASQEFVRAAFASMVARVDRYVGEIVAELEAQGILDNTVILFSSDNGAHLEGGADPEFFNSNGDFRGYKRDLTDGGIHVPMIVSWLGTIAQGSQSDHISAFWDLMPTFAELAGTPLSTPTDGISFVDELLGKEQREHDFLFWEYNDGGGAMAVRMGDWKAIRTGINKDVNSPIELYNLSEDVGETTDLAAQYPDLVDKADLIMQREHIKNDDFPFKHEKQQPEVQN